MRLFIAVMLLTLLAGCAVQQGGAMKRGGSLHQPSEQYSPSGEQPAAPVGK